MNLYATKDVVNARLAPLVDRLAAAGVGPDALTLAAIPVGVAGGLCVLASATAPALLLVVPLLVVVRLVLNLLDGGMARRTGRTHPRGELLNEVGDRLTDVAFILPVAFLPGAPRDLVFGGVLLAVLASYVGITAKAAGGERIYRGVLSKPGRMALLVAFSLLAFAADLAGSDVAVAWTAFGALLAIGAGLTLLERLVVAMRRLP